MVRGYAYKNIFHFYKDCRVIDGIQLPETEHITLGICMICSARQRRAEEKSAIGKDSP
jgi:hypothetical protein